MKRLALVLVFVAATGSASAQTKPETAPPASTAGTAGVKQHLQSLHYKNVRDLRRGPDGQWTGKAVRNGVDKTVTISPKGTVTAR
jgi:hypothetical protein